jgi:hypothetical protein
MSATTLKKRKKIFLFFACIGVFVIIFPAGLWPFPFSPNNEVRRLPGSQGLSFYGWGLAYTADSFDMTSLLENESLSIDRWLEPNTDAN